MAALPKPTILPPLVDVVWNHASTENVCGPGTAVFVATKPVVPPLNANAVLPSPETAPATPRVTPPLIVASEVPAVSKVVAPEVSANDHWSIAPSACTVSA